MDRTKRYPLIEIIFLIMSATISGCEGWKSIRDFGLLKLNWLRQLLPYENGIPIDDTIARVMRKLNTKQFANCFTRWIQAITKATDGMLLPLTEKRCDTVLIHVMRNQQFTGAVLGVLLMALYWDKKKRLKKAMRLRPSQNC